MSPRRSTQPSDEVPHHGLDWRWMPFDALSATELYDILRLRQQVFVIEQTCPYEDIDGWDDAALHLLVRTPDRGLAAYLRLFEPGVRFAEGSIGRVVVNPASRGTGLGRQVMRRGIDRLCAEFPGTSVRIEAQSHLEAFYRSLGFETVSDRYPLDGIPHIQMRLSCTGDPAGQ